ncbi:rhodanese-like domain-containing protein [Legionella quinlivanii]|uniref:rhodanese-like domain-containing protein n=1 Tax=Legionella quinlivanii TaxID=45073 RepID=UPI002243FC67|nr:rhodanese-like domain-containing protein [Legionella quinlivanii]MCW8451681.1 rhodanese-like domain-containing protein [Legionella quinlivanii]
MKQHSPGFLKLVTAAKQRIKEISPLALKEKMDSNESFHLIDVRETNEWETGHIPGAVHLGKGVIERDIEKQISDLKTPIVVYCSGGFRCALVADNLQAMGYEQVYSLESGSQGWIDAGFNLVK